MEVYKVTNEYGYVVGIEDETGKAVAGISSDGEQYIRSDTARDIEDFKCDECGGYCCLDANNTCLCSN